MPEAVATTESARASPARWGRRWLMMGLALLAVLLFAEIGARLLSDRLPEPRDWQSYEAQDKVEQMDLLAARGGADVVFVGTSLVSGAIEPFTAAARLGSGQAVYNAALSAGLPLITEPWTLDVVFPRLQPKILVVGLSSLDFADSRGARELELALADSRDGGRALGRDSLLDKVDHWVSEHSDLWRHRFELREPPTIRGAIRNRAVTPGGEYGPVGAGGRTAYSQGGRNPAAGPPVDDWRLGQESPAAIRHLIDAAQAKDIRVVLVDMPVTQAYIDRHPGRERDFRRYLAALRRLARSERVPLLEYSSLRDPELFVDQVHLRTAAGTAFTARLARELRRELRTGSR